MNPNDRRRQWGLPVSTTELDQEVSEEIAFHLEQRTQKLIDAGQSPVEACDEAQRRFGNAGAVQAECLQLAEQHQRRRLRLQVIGETFRDVRYALRTLRNRPAFALSAILTLALGIGATTAIYSVLDAVMLRSLPYSDPDRLVSLWTGVTAEAVYDEFSKLPEFEKVSAYAAQAATLTGSRGPARVSSALVSHEFFNTLGVSPLLGRGFIASDANQAAQATVVLSEKFWRDRFAADRSILDETIRLNGVPHTVIGVMPRSLRLPSGDTNLWTTFALSGTSSGAYWGNSYLQIFGRLGQGVSPETALTATRATAEHMRTTNPIWTPGEQWTLSAQVEPFQKNLAAGLSGLVSLLFGAVIAVLLVVCVNVANLFLSRASAKQHETAIRASLGAGRGRLVRQSLVEAWVVALAGTLLGLALANGLMRWMQSQLPGLNDQFGDIGLDGRVMAFALALSIITTLLFGLVPALRLTRASVSDVVRGNRGHSRKLTTASSLVVAQLALSVVLLAGAGILLTGFRDQLSTETGVDADRVVAARLDPANADFVEPASRALLYKQVIDKLNGLSTIESAAAASTLPFGTTYQTAFDAPDRDLDPNALPFGPYRRVTPGYFRTLGISILRGRDFADQETTDYTCTKQDPCEAVIDTRLSERVWQDEDALGKAIGADWLGWYQVVGIVNSVALSVLSDESPSMLYLPQYQQPQTTMQVVLRTKLSAAEIQDTLINAVQSVNAQVPVTDVRTLSEDIRASASKARLAAVLITWFAIIALLLAAIGVYGVMAYRADQRRREMGIRLALGSTAQRLQLRELIRVAMLAGAGVGAGCLAVIAAFRFLGASTLLEETVGNANLTPEIGILVALLLLVVALAAGWWPTRRASQLNPVETLRAE